VEEMGMGVKVGDGMDCGTAQIKYDFDTKEIRCKTIDISSNSAVIDASKYLLILE
jgi:hypothetical protein